MPHYLLTGAGFTRNWGGPLSSEVGGSLLGDLQNYPELTTILRKQPFENAFQGFVSGNKRTAAQQAFQDAVVNLFNRLNNALLVTTFEFRYPPVVGTRVVDFLAKFDALFTLNQDLLIEEHYIQKFGAKQGKWSGVVIPGMHAVSHDHRTSAPSIKCGSLRATSLGLTRCNRTSSFMARPIGPRGRDNQFWSWETRSPVQWTSSLYCDSRTISSHPR